MTEQTLAIRQQNGAAPALRDENAAGFAMSFGQMRARVEALHDFYRGVMQEGTDYGVIPGTPKPSLYQPGAQLLDSIFGLAPTFEELPTCVRDFERGFFAFDVRCKLVSRGGGDVVAEAVGHCNSKEDRYRWRKSERSCPSCGSDAIIKGKAEYGGGWICFAKKGGCGAKFKDGDPAIEAQESGRIENPDPYTLVNTVHKMAQKRAHVAATLNATGASRIFTQDVEDLPEFQRGGGQSAPPPEPTQQAGTAPPKAAQPSAEDKQLAADALELFNTCRAEGIDPDPPASRDPKVLRDWMATWKPKLDEKRAAAAAADAAVDARAAALRESVDRARTQEQPVQPAASVPSAPPPAPQATATTDDEDPWEELKRQPPSAPTWATHPKYGALISQLVDQLEAANKRKSPPADDAAEADLVAWIRQAESILKVAGGK